MVRNKQGNQTILFPRKPVILSAASVVGRKEGNGPLAQWFDIKLEDDTFGEKTWEKSESKMLKTAMTEALQKSGKEKNEIGAMLSGDLLNQLMSSSFMARDLHIPFLGMYGACSTMTESLMLGAVLTDGQYSNNVMIGASSHYCTAERQFRMPLEHGNQRPPSAQWTATAVSYTHLDVYKRQRQNLRFGCANLCADNLLYFVHAVCGRVLVRRRFHSV